MKKGQMEIIGLVVIVVLITLGMLFMAIFAFNDDVSKKVFTRRGLAYSTVSAVFQTTVDVEAGCIDEYAGRRNLPKLGSDILEDCANYIETKDSGPSQFHCREQHSCLFFTQTTDQLLQSSLGLWNKHYEWRSTLARADGEIELVFLKDKSNIGCSERKVDIDSSQEFDIKTDNFETITSELLVCD